MSNITLEGEQPQQVSGLVVPASSRLMEDRKFQEWLLGEGLMSRLETRVNREVSVKLSKSERSVWQTLEEHEGFIVSLYQLMPETARDDTIQLAHYHLVNQHIHRLRAKLGHPDSIFTSQGLGYGLGVTDLRIRTQTSRVLYKLWQNLGKPVSTEDLAQSVVGEKDEKAKNRVKTYVWRLRDETLPGTKTVILGLPTPKQEGYQLEVN